MSIRKLIAVARREYVETVKTKAFLLGILLMPGIIIGMVFLSTKMTVEAVKPRARSGSRSWTTRIVWPPRWSSLPIGTGRGAGSIPWSWSSFSRPARPATRSGAAQGPRTRRIAVRRRGDAGRSILQGSGTCVLHTLGAGMDDRASRGSALDYRCG